MGRSPYNTAYTGKGTEKSKTGGRSPTKKNGTSRPGLAHWLCREQLTEKGWVKALFQDFEWQLEQKGFKARKGQVVDASGSAHLSSATVVRRMPKSSGARDPSALRPILTRSGKKTSQPNAQERLSQPARSTSEPSSATAKKGKYGSVLSMSSGQLKTRWGGFPSP